MRTLGGLLIPLGLLVILAAFNMDTTTYSSGTYIGGSYVGGGSTHNLGLLQKQMMVLHTGLAAFIAGAVLLGAGAVPSGVSDGRLATRRADDLRAGETDEDYEDRIEGELKARRLAGFILIGAVLGIVLLMFAAN
jgi:hypothetical protein